MRNPATFRRNVAAAALAITAVLQILSTAVGPEWVDGFEEQLAVFGADLSSSTLSAMTFLFAQLTTLVAALGVAHLLRGSTPVLANLVPVLLGVGCFGHAVHGGVMMTQLEMAADPANARVYAGLLEAVEGGPAVAFMAMGLLGTVLGTVLLGVALLRSRLGPRWVGAGLLAFVVLEFAGSGLSDWAARAAVLLFALCFLALARTVAASGAAEWEVGRTLVRQPQPA